MSNMATLDEAIRWHRSMVDASRAAIRAYEADIERREYMISRLEVIRKHIYPEGGDQMSDEPTQTPAPDSEPDSGTLEDAGAEPDVSTEDNDGEDTD
jgi:hypothetical protein